MAADERLAAEISAFLAGRLDFNRLLANLRWIVDDAAPDEGGAPASEALSALLDRCVTMRRLPPDLAAAIREGVLAGRGPAGPLPGAGPDLLAAAAATADTRPAGADGDDDQPTVRLAATGPPPEADPLAGRVDEVVLSALVENYRGYRSRRPSADGAGPSRSDRATDALLSQFAGARVRRDAARASTGHDNPARMEARKRAQRSNEEAAPRVGTLLKDRFVLDEEIGGGGMGTVFKAVDLRRLEAAHADPYVAIKVLSREFARDFRAFQTLEAEARKAQMLSHPNIIHVHDFDRDAGHAFIVMELLSGKDLARVLVDRGKLPFDLAARVFSGVFDALAYAHARNVVHSDVKPANIFLPENGRVKVLDFGIAVASGLTGFDVGELGSFTHAYASPDVLNGRPQTVRDDVYALGVTIYQALTGQHPFSNRHALEAIDLGLKPARIGDMPGPSWAALRRALAFDRTERFDTMEAFRDAFYRRGLLGRLVGRGPRAEG